MRSPYITELAISKTTAFVLKRKVRKFIRGLLEQGAEDKTWTGGSKETE
jgi:hypothetical protein